MGRKMISAVLLGTVLCGGLAHGSERLRKFDLALKTLGIPPEPAPDFSDYPVAGSVSTADVLSIARIIDPEGGLRRYLSITLDRITLFPSFYSASGGNDLPDFDLATGAPTNQDSPELIDRLDRIARNVRAGNRTAPFRGLRVVIDPGHMGTPFWNDKDGKYVTVGGKTVAEGELTLSTAKLLATELEKLGAEVLLTRTELAPVTPYTWDNFDPTARLADYYYKSRDDWMGKYLALSDAELVRQLPNAPEVRKMSTYSGRVALYLQEDLDARAKVAEAYHPDLFIDLHYDSQAVDALQSKRDDVSVYVPGAVGKIETGARNQRADALKHLLDVRRWKQSAQMAKILVDQVSKKLGVPLLRDGEPGTMIKVEDGVFARNIFETKRATTSLSVFFESFHYDYVKEFPRLTTLDREATYHGEKYRYPARLEAVSNGIRDGLLRYFDQFSAD
jgi:N-acetylmuramoyl-L-alanine amidase